MDNAECTRYNTLVENDCKLYLKTKLWTQEGGVARYSNWNPKQVGLLLIIVDINAFLPHFIPNC